MTEVLITAEDLAQRLRDGESLALLDVRWQLGQPDGSGAYAAGHIPGAVYVDLEYELSAAGEPADGRHPLPSTEQLQANARRWGLRAGQRVVAYDDIGGMSAARVWWLLRDAGVTVSILDGGLQAWQAAGGELELGTNTPPAGDVVLTHGLMPQLDIDDAAALPATGVLLDARAPERYRGDTEPMDPQAGHIPGAQNLPTSGNLDEQGFFLDAATLRARFEAAGLGEGQAIGVYCGSGITASHEIAALEHAGFSAALYPGSWSQWSNTPGRSVATGDAA